MEQIDSKKRTCEDQKVGTSVGQQTDSQQANQTSGCSCSRLISIEGQASPPQARVPAETLDAMAWEPDADELAFAAQIGAQDFPAQIRERFNKHTQDKTKRPDWLSRLANEWLSTVTQWALLTPIIHDPTDRAAEAQYRGTADHAAKIARHDEWAAQDEITAAGRRQFERQMNAGAYGVIPPHQRSRSDLFPRKPYPNLRHGTDDETDDDRKANADHDASDIELRVYVPSRRKATLTGQASDSRYAHIKYWEVPPATHWPDLTQPITPRNFATPSREWRDFRRRQDERRARRAHAKREDIHHRVRALVAARRKRQA